jgi:hypothetical protein
VVYDEMFRNFSRESKIGQEELTEKGLDGGSYNLAQDEYARAPVVRRLALRFREEVIDDREPYRRLEHRLGTFLRVSFLREF